MGWAVISGGGEKTNICIGYKTLTFSVKSKLCLLYISAILLRSQFLGLQYEVDYVSGY